MLICRRCHVVESLIRGVSGGSGGHLACLLKKHGWIEAGFVVLSSCLDSSAPRRCSGSERQIRQIEIYGPSG